MITLPTKFENDIQGKDTYLVPLVIINNSIYLSTAKVTLNNQHYDPLLKSLGNIKQSIDIVDKKFKISSVSMQFYNYEYNNSILTERMFSKEVMNTPLDIYYKSQSAETLDDCLRVYSGYIKNMQEKTDSLTLDIEDRTEQTLHKDLPYRYNSDNLPDNHKDKLIPIVYGKVDNCVAVYNEGLNYGNENRTGYSVVVDDFYIKELKIPKVFSGDVYAELVEDATTWGEQIVGTGYSNSTSIQYEIIDNKLYIEKVMSTPEGDNSYLYTITGLSGSSISFDFAEVEVITTPTFVGGDYTLYFTQPTDTPPWPRCTTEVLAFKDTEGQIPVYNPQSNYYLYPTVFANNDGVEMPFDIWAWEQNHPYSNDYTVLWGGTTLTFEAGGSFSDGDIAQRLIMPNGNYSNIETHVKLWITANALVEATYADGNFTVMPTLYMANSDSTGKIWQMGAAPSSHQWPVGEPQEVSIDGEMWYGPWQMKTRKSHESRFTVGMYQRAGFDSEFELDSQMSGIVHYINIENLTLTRRMILKEFSKHTLYADVEGRIDNSHLRYTSDNIYSPSSMEQYYQDSVSSRARYSSTQPKIAKPKARKTARKTMKKPVRRTPSKGGGKGGGY